MVVFIRAILEPLLFDTLRRVVVTASYQADEPSSRPAFKLTACSDDLSA